MSVARDLALSKIKRYGDNNVMFYRSNVHRHSSRVSLLVETVSSTIAQVFPKFNYERAVALALVHDDVEIITGDVTLKRKLAMSDSQKAALKVKELAAIPVLVERYGSSFRTFDYAALLREASDKFSLEMAFVSYFDKLDGFGECLHEVVAGNPDVDFVQKSIGYKVTLDFMLRRGVLSEVSGRHVLFSQPSHIVPRFCHSIESLVISSGNVIYDAWRDVVVRNGAVDDLIKRKE